MEQDKSILEAAAQLEDFTVIAKTMCNELREGADNPYARVYWLRKQLGYAVALLGEGVPTGLKEIERHYERIIGRSE